MAKQKGGFKVKGVSMKSEHKDKAKRGGKRRGRKHAGKK